MLGHPNTFLVLVEEIRPADGTFKRLTLSISTR